MPIHNLGYREWDGDTESGNSRWMVIAGIGIRRAWKSKWLKRLSLVVWGPPLFYGFMIFLFEQFLARGELGRPGDLERAISAFLPQESIRAVIEAIRAAQTIGADDQMLTIVRPLVWKATMLRLMRSQAIGMIIVIGLVAPSLISHDVRSRAFLLYFSRPLSRLQYIIGKFSTVGFFLLITCTLPQLVLYAFAVLLSPDISVLAYTWDLPLRVIAASAMMLIPTTLLALMLSSLTTESRFATFGWFFVWIFGFAAWVLMSNMGGQTSELVIRLSFLYLLFSDLSVWILDLDSVRNPHLETQIIFACALAAVSFTVIFRNVSAPLRA